MTTTTSQILSNLTGFTPLGAMLYAHRYHGLPWRVAWLQASTMLILPVLHWHENVTVVAFAWAAWYVPACALFALQKLPFGWSWNLSDAHYKCLDTCFHYAAAHPSGILGVFFRDLDHNVIYALLAGVVLLPLVTRAMSPNHRPRHLHRGSP